MLLWYLWIDITEAKVDKELYNVVLLLLNSGQQVILNVYFIGIPNV